MAIHPDASAPTPAALRRVQAESHGRYAGNACDRIVDAPVERRELLRPVAGKPWIHARHDAPVLFESEILILEISAMRP